MAEILRDESEIRILESNSDDAQSYLQLPGLRSVLSRICNLYSQRLKVYGLKKQIKYWEYLQVPECILRNPILLIRTVMGEELLESTYIFMLIRTFMRILFNNIVSFVLSLST